MKRYLYNIIIAILGRNPYKMELEKLTKELEETLEAVNIRDMRIRSYEAVVETQKQTINDFKRQTENLRDRIKDKDIAIQENRKLHRMQLNGLREDLNVTLEKLQKANKLLGQECMSKTMLERTNQHLNDLAQAMNSGDEEKMKQVVEYLGWSDPLAHIAQRHLSTLRLYHECVERLHFSGYAEAEENVNHE